MVLPAILGGATAFGLGSLLGGSGGFEFFTKKEQRVNAPTVNISSPTQIISPTQSFQIIGSPNASIRGSQSSQGTQPTSQTATPLISLGQGGGSGTTKDSPFNDVVRIGLLGGAGFLIYAFITRKRK